MSLNRRTLLALGAAALVVLAGAVVALRSPGDPRQRIDPAQASEGLTLARIRASGKIILGYRESSVPFSYYDKEGKVVGYSQDIAAQIIAAIRQQLKLPDLPVEWVPVTAKNRFDLMEAGAIDLECGSTGNTAERQKRVGYGTNFFAVSMRILTRKDYEISEVDDLAGRTVVTTAGTTNEGRVFKLNQDRKLGMTIRVAPDHREAFLELESRKADAFLMDDVLLYGERTRAVRWGDWIITGAPQTLEAYACIFAKGDTPFKTLVDGVVTRILTSPEGENLYRKWFLSPIPPNGINLDFPMSEAQRALMAAPHDRPLGD